MGQIIRRVHLSLEKLDLPDRLLLIIGPEKSGSQRRDCQELILECFLDPPELFCRKFLPSQLMDFQVTKVVGVIAVIPKVERSGDLSNPWKQSMKRL
jgi:hypothetical protein